MFGEPLVQAEAFERGDVVRSAADIETLARGVRPHAAHAGWIAEEETAGQRRGWHGPEEVSGSARWFAEVVPRRAAEPPRE